MCYLFTENQKGKGLRALLTITVPAVRAIRTAFGSFHEIWQTRLREPTGSRFQNEAPPPCFPASGASPFVFFIIRVKANPSQNHLDSVYR